MWVSIEKMEKGSMELVQICFMYQFWFLLIFLGSFLGAFNWFTWSIFYRKAKLGFLDFMENKKIRLIKLFRGNRFLGKLRKSNTTKDGKYGIIYFFMEKKAQSNPQIIHFFKLINGCLLAGFLDGPLVEPSSGATGSRQNPSNRSIQTHQVCFFHSTFFFFTEQLPNGIKALISALVGS